MAQISRGHRTIQKVSLWKLYSDDVSLEKGLRLHPRSPPPLGKSRDRGHLSLMSVAPGGRTALRGWQLYTFRELQQLLRGFLSPLNIQSKAWTAKGVHVWPSERLPTTTGKLPVLLPPGGWRFVPGSGDSRWPAHLTWTLCRAARQWLDWRCFFTAISDH